MRFDLLRKIMFCVAISGCATQTPVAETMTVATTTSVQESGLLAVLIPRFKQQTGIEVKIVAVGSGQALELGRRGDADVLLTHSPKAEESFVSEGFGEDRRTVMHNDFVVVGPKDDPAGIRVKKTAVEAFVRIAEQQSPFVSRGDDSGTHQKEKQIWSEASIEPTGEWYIKSGAGMAQTLRIATEKGAYTLADRASYLAQRTETGLRLLFEGDPRLKNRYSVIAVSQKKHAHVQRKLAAKFVDFLLDPATQSVIGDFGKDVYGEPLFFTGTNP